MFNFTSLLATTTEGGGDIFGTIIWFVIMAIFVIFVIVIPAMNENKTKKEHANMLDSLAPGDEVTTVGGIIGKVVSIKEDTFVLETTKDKTKIRLLISAIHSVDFKASDLAAQIIESKKATDEVTTDEASDEAADENAKGKKSKKK